MKKHILPCSTAIAESSLCVVTNGNLSRVITKAEEEETAKLKLSKHKRR